MSVGRGGPLVVRDYFKALGKERVDPVVACDPLTDVCRQADAESCDINRIVAAQMRQFGQIPEVPGQLYADVSAGWDYREVLEKAEEAKEFFLAMPAEVREAYGNDPGTLLEALLDPAEVPRLQELGILKKDPVSEVPGEVPASPPA